jgi:hypothetical protein
MPYLNWKDPTRLKHQLKQEIAPYEAGGDEGGRQRLTLSLEGQPLKELLLLLREVFSAGGELRLDLPRGWAIFWKKREGESRLLLAHPQHDEWVATCALTAEHGAQAIERLEALGAGQRLDLGELAVLGGLSNLELTLVHL